jgi:hypothetical protein
VLSIEPAAQRLQDAKRLNVSMSRAKSALHIFGNMKTLCHRPGAWRRCVELIEENRRAVLALGSTYDDPLSECEREVLRARRASAAVLMAGPP